MIANILLFCSGADRHLIALCPNPEKNKYASIGATVLLTGILASVSGGYALYTIFHQFSVNEVVNNSVSLTPSELHFKIATAKAAADKHATLQAIFFGLLWGAVIFNLDRYIVSSLRKEGNWKKELIYATPRFIIAILVSLVIAKPLEVRIFESRIEQQILEDKRKKLEDEKLSIDKLNDLTKLDNQVSEKSAQLKGLEPLRFSDPPSDDFKGLLKSRNNAVVDLKNTSQTNNPKIADYNSRISALISNPNNYVLDSLNAPTDKLLPEFKKQRSELKYSKILLIEEIRSKQSKIDDIDSDIKKARQDYQANISKKIKDKEADIALISQTKQQADSVATIQMNESYEVKDRSYTNNFVTQVEALGHLKANMFTTMWWTGILLMLLFIAIETAPIVVKLLTKRGSYDELLDRVEYEHYLEQQKIISDRNDEINNLLIEIQVMNKLKGEVRLKTEKAKLDAELKSNTSLLDEIAKRQAELASIAVDKWYKEELSKLKNKPNHQYAKSKQQQSSPTIVGKLWKATNLKDEVFFLFNNGKLRNNELVYMESGKTHIGTWEYLNPNNEILMNILSNSEIYTIENLTDDSVKLKATSNDYLELIRV